jgi:hypothetical protein
MPGPKDYELLPTDLWATEMADGFYLNDPITGQPLSPNAPPSFLLEKTALLDGRDYLEGLLSGVALGLLYATGETDYEDLGGSEFEQLVQSSHHNIQAVGHAVDGVARMPDNNDMILLPTNGTPFTERIAISADSADIATFCMGLEVDMDGLPASRTERALQAIRDIVAVEAYDQTDQGLWLQSLRAVSRNIHQWYRVLSAGERMQHISAGLQSRGEALRNVLVVPPIADADYTRKFAALGMQNVIEQAVDHQSFTEDMRWETNVMETCRIVPEE